MKPFPMQELVDLIAQIKGGNATVSKRLAKYTPLLEQLWLLVVKVNGLCDAAFKRSAFTELYDVNRAYDEAKIDELLEDLRDFVDLFYRANNQENTALGQKAMADTLRSHGYNKLADRAIRKTLRLAEKEPEIIQHLINLFIHNDKHLKEKGIIADREIYLQEKNNLNLLLDLDSIIDELSKLRRLRKETSDKLLQKIKAAKVRIPSKPTPLIAIQQKAVEYFLNPSLGTYQAFKSIFFEKVDLLRSNQANLLYYLIKALMVFPNTPREVRQDYILLYEFGIDRGLFLEQGKVKPLMFDNIVFTAQSLGDYRLVRKAIDAYKGKILGEGHRDRSLSIAKAYLFYGNGAYAKALEILTALDTDNYLNAHLVIKKFNLGFKCAYEQSADKQNAVIYMDFKEGTYKGRLRIYLAKENIGKSDRLNCLNFFELLYAIASRKMTGITKEGLKKMLENYEGNILELKWLTEKLKELD